VRTTWTLQVAWRTTIPAFELICLLRSLEMQSELGGAVEAAQSPSLVRKYDTALRRQPGRRTSVWKALIETAGNGYMCSSRQAVLDGSDVALYGASVLSVKPAVSVDPSQLHPIHFTLQNSPTIGPKFQE
jgi:hypothetical protein